MPKPAGVYRSSHSSEHAKAGCWCCCVLLWCMLCRAVPFDQRENSNALPAVCQTDLLPQLGRTAALLAPLVQAGTIPGPADSEADLLLEALSTGVLGLWVAIVTADNMEEGFSICEPRCLDVLPPICALTRAVLCRLPDISALSKDVGGVFSLASRGVANYLCGHLHMQVRHREWAGCACLSGHTQLLCVRVGCTAFPWLLLGAWRQALPVVCAGSVH